MVPWTHPSPNANGMSTDSAVFVGLTSVTDRQGRPTDRPTNRSSSGSISCIVTVSLKCCTTALPQQSSSKHLSEIGNFFCFCVLPGIAKP